MASGSSKFASFSIFCKLPKPQVFVIHLSKTGDIVDDSMDNTVYQQKSSLELYVLVMCEVALQSKSAQIVATNVYWETPQSHNSYTPLTLPQ